MLRRLLSRRKTRHLTRWDAWISAELDKQRRLRRRQILRRWIRACRWDQIDPRAPVVRFSHDNPERH